MPINRRQSRAGETAERKRGVDRGWQKNGAWENEDKKMGDKKMNVEQEDRVQASDFLPPHSLPFRLHPPASHFLVTDFLV